MINQDEVRKEIAVKNNVWLGQNDPILQSVTIFENALEQSVATLNEQNEKHLKVLLNALQQGNVEAKRTAAAVIKEAAGYVSDQAHNAITNAISEGRDQFRKDLRIAVAKIEELRKATFVAAGVSFGCAILALGSLWFTVT